MKVRANYKFLHDKLSSFSSDFWFQVVPRDNKEVWLVQENSSHNYDQIKTVEMSEITPVAFKDTARFTLEIYTKAGLIDWNSIEFQPAQIENQNKQLHETECFIEKQVEYWSSVDFPKDAGFQKEKLISKPTESSGGSLFNFDCFDPFLRLVSQHFYGVDTRITRCKYKAIQFGNCLSRGFFDFWTLWIEEQAILLSRSRKLEWKWSFLGLQTSASQMSRKRGSSWTKAKEFSS